MKSSKYNSKTLNIQGLKLEEEGILRRERADDLLASGRKDILPSQKL